MSFVNMLASRLASKCWLPTYQQVRFVRPIRIDHGYGVPPLTQPDQLAESKETGHYEKLAYEKIRFAQIDESCSPLWDRDLEYFTNYVMMGGRKDLAYKLMHETFYEIKSIQYKRLQKRNDKEEAAATTTSGTPAKVQNPVGIAGGQEDEEDKIETNPLNIFKRALKNSEPFVVTRKVRRGGATYQVPFPISAKQSEWMAIKWLIQAVKDRPKPRLKLFPEVMAQELLDAAHMRGKVIKRRDDMHKLADANKAYAHYRWG